MLTGARRALRFVSTWLTGRAGVHRRDVTVDRGDRAVEATLVTPDGRGAPRPTWIALHGITRPGRGHDELVRFVDALASTGCAVLVPDVPEWRELELAPHLTVPTLAASIRRLRVEGVTGGRPVGVIGFSFGSPQAVVASADPTIADDVGAVVGFGGYCDLERTVRFQLTGRHEWDGREHRLDPDPYGRWIVFANFLASIPGYDDAGDVERALRALAREAGDRRTPSWDPVYDPLKEALRREVAPARRELFDLFAPPSDREPPDLESERFAPLLADAARAEAPLMEPSPALGRVAGPVHLLHGRNDRLIPFTEALRMRRHIEPEALSQLSVTRLFAHSGEDERPRVVETVREGASFLRALGKLLAAV